jgi:hypothetical protein
MAWFNTLFNHSDGGEDKDKDADEVSVPSSTIFRWYLYDTAISDHKVIAELMGLTPISEEGEVKELEDSVERLDKLSFILPFINAMADVSSNFMTAVHLTEAKKSNDVEVTDEDTEAMLSVYRLVALSTLVGSLSIALTLGLVQPSGVFSEHYDDGGLLDE